MGPVPYSSCSIRALFRRRVPPVVRPPRLGTAYVLYEGREKATWILFGELGARTALMVVAAG